MDFWDYVFLSCMICAFAAIVIGLIKKKDERQKQLKYLYDEIEKLKEAQSNQLL